MNPQQELLLVEDSPTQALQLVQTFERDRWQVHWARTAEEALEKLSEISPAVIVLDYYLPGMRGDELCRRLRMHVGTQNVPILMLTTDQTLQAEVHGLDSGADDFVAKSADSEVLLMRLRALLGKSRRLPSLPGQADCRLSSARILSIDDSRTYQEFLVHELTQEGYHVQAAMDGVKGLELIAQGGLDCVLVDLMMPEMDGVEVCRRINALWATMENHVAVLMLTARENKEDLTRALDAGADDFVSKSSDTSVLKGRIRALLRRKSFQEEHVRIQQELKKSELETLRAIAAKEVAEAKAALNDELEQRVRDRTAELDKVNRELAHKNHENEMFVYSVSHDLRSPLVNLQGFSHELASVTKTIRDILSGPELPAQLRERGLALVDGDMTQSIGFIQTSVMRLSRIIDALLGLSRVGRVEYQWQLVDVESTVGAIITSMGGTIDEKGAQITVASLPATWGDPTAIEQIFANLIGNALNYLDAKRLGTIEIGCSNFDNTLSPNAEPHFHTYYVRDNGLGIPDAHRAKLFHPFQRLHPGAAKGEGIGLTLIRRVVDRHGGKIWFESVENEGSVFFVTLPARAMANQVQAFTEIPGTEKEDEDHGTVAGCVASGSDDGHAQGAEIENRRGRNRMDT